MTTRSLNERVPLTDTLRLRILAGSSIWVCPEAFDARRHAWVVLADEVVIHYTAYSALFAARHHPHPDVRAALERAAQYLVAHADRRQAAMA